MSEINTDSGGRLLKFDVREDEEQYQKFQEIIQILIAAGYFRARIKGLTDFDKVIGGMTWCIIMCSVDIDIDLMYSENLTIGQKISLTEKIVTSLKRMKCPFALEPHQIQGMDSKHIFPVVQWLVKMSIQYRQENEVYMKNFAVRMFNKDHNLPIDQQRFSESNKLKQEFIHSDPDTSPVRKYRHPNKSKINDLKTNVKITILEYKGLADTVNESTNTEKSSSPESVEHAETISLIDDMKQDINFKLSSSIVGSIMSEKYEELKQIAEDFTRNQLKLAENSLEYREKVLRETLSDYNNRISEAKSTQENNNNRLEALRMEIDSIKNDQKQFSLQIRAMEENEREERKNLSLELDKLKREKDNFHQNCKQEKKRLEKEYETLSNQLSESGDEDEIEKQLEAERSKFRKIALKLAEKIKEVSLLHRKLDDIPSRAELNQYQKRLVELYNQVAAKHNETKKFYILYNQLEDTRVHLDKELALLDSILTNFNLANTNLAAREQFLSQFEQIVENINLAKVKVEKKRLIEKRKKDQLNEVYVDLIEKQRQYYRAVSQLKEEMKKNESLINSNNN
ncbi:coiled-coil domain-containing protein 93-like [Panonychus citri]|uniref:coiled-coil domain-containing protein 93-like n=1 Tax=Panonychus citri TaxID=50023 RepID=UPI002307C446|nr:coiled-coil domain-containing protein 93-like [Panonychus citri]